MNTQGPQRATSEPTPTSRDAPLRGPLFAVALASAACAGSTDRSEPTGHAGEAIVHGDADADDEAVVALMTAGDGAYCTGALISPYVVVTAAHCVSPRVPDQIYFGSRPSKGDGTLVDVSDTLAHPDFDPDNLTNDIALVRLAERAPVTPLRYAKKSLDGELDGLEIRLVGFGVPDPESSSLRKRTGTTSITKVGKDDFRFSAQPSQTCLGDSGGPALADVDDREIVIGLASSGDPECKKYGRHTRIDPYVDFIEEYVATASSGTPYEGASGVAVVAGRGCAVSGARAGALRDREAAGAIALALGAAFARRARRRRL